jgi:5-methylthioadenosine/S-adenosylhomocysteine deaminase
LNAETVLSTLTQGGARCLGLENLTGALFEGAQADITVVALDGTHQTPLHDALAALIFSSSGRDVLMTMVAGNIVFSDGRVLTVDEDGLRARMKEIERKVIGDG